MLALLNYTTDTVNPDSPTLLALWSGPRNVSTALMYAFAQREDCRVFDEPFFGHFLRHTGVARPSREEALRTMRTDPVAVLQHVQQSTGKPFHFLKNMANHTVGTDLGWLSQYRNVILTRHPRKVIASYTRQIDCPTLLDLCYAEQWAIIQQLEGMGLPVCVVDSDAILAAPEAALRRMCAAFQLPFDAAMLKWPAGARPEDGVWAKYWYHSVHQSTGWAAPDSSRTYEVPDHLNDLYTTSLTYYQKIKSYE